MCLGPVRKVLGILRPGEWIGQMDHGPLYEIRKVYMESTKESNKVWTVEKMESSLKFWNPFRKVIVRRSWLERQEV